MYLVYMYNQDLELNNLRWLICHKNKPNQTMYVCMYVCMYSWSLLSQAGHRKSQGRQSVPTGLFPVTDDMTCSMCYKVYKSVYTPKRHTVVNKYWISQSNLIDLVERVSFLCPFCFRLSGSTAGLIIYLRVHEQWGADGVSLRFLGTTVICKNVCCWHVCMYGIWSLFQKLYFFPIFFLIISNHNLMKSTQIESS